MNQITEARRSWTAVALIVVVAVVAGACGAGNNAGPASPTRAAERGTTTTSSSTTLVTPPPAKVAAASEKVGPSVKFSRPADAVRHLYRAWRQGNRDAAAAAASDKAVRDLFARRSVELSGSECTHSTGATRCFMDGEGYSIIFEVSPSRTHGFQVAAISVATHPDNAQQPASSPSAIASPGEAAIGDTVRLEGRGFIGDPWEAEDAVFYLVGGDDDCALYAMARDTLFVDDNGRLSGDFVVPAVGECRMTKREEAVTPGRYQLAYSCTACIVGEIVVVK